MPTSPTILKFQSMKKNGAALHAAGYTLEQLREMTAAEIASAIGREILKELPRSRAAHYPNIRED